MDHRDVNKQV